MKETKPQLADLSMGDLLGNAQKREPPEIVTESDFFNKNKQIG